MTSGKQRILILAIALSLFAVSCGSATGTAEGVDTTEPVESTEPAAVESNEPDPVETTTAADSTTTTTAATTTTVEAETTTTTTIAETASTNSTLVSYEFPSGLDDAEHPTQLQGLLGLPDGPGPFPVAIVMHGSHPPCVDDFNIDVFSDTIVTESVEFLCGETFPEYIRHDIGLGHVVTALNNAGIAAISIDVEAAYVWWGGEPNEFESLETIVTTHLDVLRSLNSGDDLGLDLDPITGRLDLTQISVVGHSRSGGHIESIIDATRTLPFEPFAAVMIEPAPAALVDSHLDIPVLLIRGECDEDVGPEAGLLDFGASVSPDRSSRVTDMFIPAAGHRSINTGLVGSTCPDRGDRAAIQTQVAEAAASFITTQGEELVVIDGVGATIEPLVGSLPTLVPSTDLVDFDPLSVPAISSDFELLPAIPEGADFSDVLIEDF